MTPTKVCFRCQKEKLVNYFDKNPASFGGYINTCQACRSELRKQHKAGKLDVSAEMRKWK